MIVGIGLRVKIAGGWVASEVAVGGLGVGVVVRKISGARVGVGVGPGANCTAINPVQ